MLVRLQGVVWSEPTAQMDLQTVIMLLVNSFQAKGLHSFMCFAYVQAKCPSCSPCRCGGGRLEPNLAAEHYRNRTSLFLVLVCR